MHPEIKSDASTAPPDRRNVLLWLSALLGGLATLALGVPIVGYLLGPVLRRQSNAWIKLGPVSDFPEKQTRLIAFTNPNPQAWDGATAEASAYVRNQGAGEFQIFAVNCAHLGCPVSWFPQSGLFLCPCHGGVYYADGERASGPPPHGLFTYDYKLEEGNLFIWGNHLPTMHDPLRRRSTEKA